jgi:hypothetical protein
MSGNGSIIASDVFDIAPPLIAFSMLSLAFFTFSGDHAFAYLLELAGLGTPAGGMYVYAAFALAIVALSFLRVWGQSLLNAITYLSWALYIPSVLSFCGIDPFKIIRFTYDFSFFSTGLSATVIAIVGVALACGSLMEGSFMNLRDARDNFLSRGADKKEVSRVLYRNASFESRVVLATAAVIVLAMIGIQLTEQNILGILNATGFAYIIAGLCAVVILALVFLIYLWPRMDPQKK